MPADRQVLPGRRTFLIRVVRATAAALFLMGTSVAAMVVEPAPVVAIDEGRGTPGHCPDADGVTVVIDFQELGGDTIIRCAPGDQETGHSALVNAGIEIEGTNRWGESFICRIEGKPGPEDEPCIDTPPASAYWSYWHAPNDGAWTYSQWGVMNRTPPPGSFEGWSFSKDRTEDTNPPPRVAPVRPTEGSGSDGSGGSGGSGGFGGSGGGSGEGHHGGHDRGGDGPAGEDTEGRAGSAPGDGPEDGSGEGETEDGDGGGPDDEPSRFDEPAPGPDDLPVEASDWTGGGETPELVSNIGPVDDLPWGTLIGGAAAVLLAVVGLATAWQRRREGGAHSE